MRNTDKKGRPNRSFSCYDDEWEHLNSHAKSQGFSSVSEYIWEAVKAYEGDKKEDKKEDRTNKEDGVYIKIPEGFTCEIKLKGGNS